MLKVKFENNKALFFAALRERTDRYFKQNKLEPTGNQRLYIKSIVLFISLVLIYATLVFITPSSIWLSLLLCSLLGINFATIGFNVMHDGAHGSYSTRKWINNTMAHALNLMGGNAYLWNQKHNINHHTFTNIEGMDDDIDLKPFLRIHTEQKKMWFHRFQHFYMLLLYGLTLLFWVFYRDFLKYFTGKIAEHTPMKKMQRKDHINFWVSKTVHIALFLVLPMLLAGVVETIIGYTVMAFTAGVVLAIVFQLAHVVEESDFVHGEETVSIQSEWAVHQIKTTANFATRSRFLSWMLGGLNFQVEHHLFPKVSHIHYPRINRIVKATCQEFGIEYREYPTMLSAVRSHFSHMRRIGRS